MHQEKKKLELNDLKAGTSIVRNFQSFVVEAYSHGKFSFLGKNYRNYFDKAMSLCLGAGDAKVNPWLLLYKVAC